jgi:Xaa-Pro aminopeptidase
MTPTADSQLTDRASSISAAVGRHGLAAVVVTAPDNVGYLSGFYHPDLRYVPKRLHIVVWPAQGAPVCVVPAPRALHWMGQGDKTFLGPEDGRPTIADVRAYEGEGVAGARTVGDVLHELGIEHGFLGVESTHLPEGFAAGLRRSCPDLQLVDAANVLDEVITAKPDADVQGVVAINTTTAHTLEEELALARPGESERDVSARIVRRLWEQGATELVHGILAVGPRSSGWHALPSANKLVEGQLIRTDWGVRCERGYASDIARNVVVGKASAEQKDRFARISEAHDAVVDAVRPGVLASELAKLARRRYEQLGLEFRWGIAGHGIGRTVQEAPLLWPDVHEPVREGQTLQIELGYFGEAEVYHIEDLIRVTAQGAVNLTQPAPRFLMESTW